MSAGIDIEKLKRIPIFVPVRDDATALANRLQIGERGVPEANIHTADLCTACRQELFFSHRASGGQSGRQVNFLMLRPGDRRKNA